MVLLDSVGEISRVVTDDRTAAMRGLTRRKVAEWRNHEGGFWVASTNPAAAEQAITGSVPTGPVLACTDGVSRLVDHFGHDNATAALCRPSGPHHSKQPCP